MKAKYLQKMSDILCEKIITIEITPRCTHTLKNYNAKIETQFNLQ